MISRKSSRKLIGNFPKNKWKHNVSLKVFHETNTKTIEMFWSITNQTLFTVKKKLPKPIEGVQYKDLKYTLKSMNAVIILLVISFLGS